MRVVGEDGTSNPEAGGPLQPELQFARCMSNRYRSEEFPRCVSCTRRWAGDTCRFQGIRFFLKNQNRDIVGISFVESQKPDAPTMNFPNKWNVSLEKEHILRVKVGSFSASSLLSLWGETESLTPQLAADGGRGASARAQGGDGAPRPARDHPPPARKRGPGDLR